MIIVSTFGARAMAIQPITHGNRPSLIVFNRPIDSIKKPATMHPMGTDITRIEAIVDDSVWVTGISLSELSSFGMRMAEKANEIPMTI